MEAGASAITSVLTVCWCVAITNSCTASVCPGRPAQTARTSRGEASPRLRKTRLLPCGGHQTRQDEVWHESIRARLIQIQRIIRSRRVKELAVERVVGV